jgi:hypothetical protein
MQRMTSRKRIGILAIAASFGILGCREGTAPAPVSRAADQLHFIRPAPGASSLPDTAVTFWARRGEDRELRLYYNPQSLSGTGEEFLRFTVPAAALAQRPDGSAITVGDSVLISVRVIDPSRLIVEFQPSGLRFSAGSPARLRFELAETDSDLNGDGVVNAEDDSVKTQLSFWRQEAPGQPWLKVASAVFTDLNEVEANVLGFSGYALAY